MKKPLTALWIDDDSKKRKESENLGKRLNLKVEYRNVKDKDLQEELNRILDEQEPDLILMDHKLNMVKENAYKTGSTAAEFIREKPWTCPIVCVTGVSLKDIDLHKQSIYEEIFEFEKISSYDSTLTSIVESFKKLKKNTPQNIEAFIDLLKTTEDDLERLKSVIPTELKKKELYQDKSLLQMISKWVRKTLMEKPGFLYDRLWTATLLGIKEESFTKVENIFSDAKYSGIFADEGNERWWQSKLREILFSQSPGSDEIYPWKLGRKLPGIDEADFSKCPHPEEDHTGPYTVAYTDEAAKKRAQMCLRHTVPHPNFEKSLFFEEIRMMKGAE
jgi:CheY-like chemotaxis protein